VVFPAALVQGGGKKKRSMSAFFMHALCLPHLLSAAFVACGF
jgi:hypothetical protein